MILWHAAEITLVNLCLSASFSVFLCLFVHLSVPLFLSFCLYCLSVSLSLILYLSPSLCVSVCRSMSLSLSLSQSFCLCLSTSLPLSFRLSVSQFLPLSISLSLSISVVTLSWSYIWPFWLRVIVGSGKWVILEHNTAHGWNNQCVIGVVSENAYSSRILWSYTLWAVCLFVYYLQRAGLYSVRSSLLLWEQQLSTPLDPGQPYPSSQNW